MAGDSPSAAGWQKVRGVMVHPVLLLSEPDIGLTERHLIASSAPGSSRDERLVGYVDLIIYTV